MKAGKEWGQEEKGTIEDEMVGWHHRLNGHGFGWTLGVGDGQGSLACCGSWGHKESDTTERLNWRLGISEVIAHAMILDKTKVAGDCSHEIKRRLLLGRKVMTNLDSIFKSRDITLSTKVRLVKAVVFPVVMYGFESWTIKKLSTEELMLLNCGVEDSWESLRLQGDPTSPS